jgi:SAM-dependent methyltransferase
VSNSTTFGQQAEVYARGRPSYPAALFDWIAQRSPGLGCVLDVATGSGQAARSLVAHFAQVEATDVDANQIAAVEAHPRIRYRVAPAEASGLAHSSVDAVTVATALHWFAIPQFWAEVDRVLRPGGLFCAFVYPLPRVSGALQEQVLEPIYRLIDPFWADGNRLAMAGYSATNTGCPWPVIDTPALDAGGDWSGAQLMAFARTWSAHLRAREAGHLEALEQLEALGLALAGADTLAVSMPLSILAARKPEG